MYTVPFNRYAYSEEAGDEFDEEAISLTSGLKVVGERKEKKGSASAASTTTTTTTDHVILGLREDAEEDKQE